MLDESRRRPGATLISAGNEHVDQQTRGTAATKHYDDQAEFEE